jgi:hypothetical protein
MIKFHSAQPSKIPAGAGAAWGMTWPQDDMEGERCYHKFKA